MEFTTFFKLAVFLCFFHLSNARELLETKPMNYTQAKYADLLETKPMNYTQAKYDGALARTMLEYSAIVYVSDVQRIKAWSCLRCIGITSGFEVTEVIVDLKQGLQAFVGYDKNINAIVVAFRGTKLFIMKNWLVDAATFQLDLDYPGMNGIKMHSGFFYAYHMTDIQPGVFAALDKAKAAHAGARIVITGHSLGGAMAAVCALDLTLNSGYKDLEVITFGQPRIGNAAFSDFYSQHLPQTIRVVSKHDIVPQVPPFLPRFPRSTYHHFGTEVWVHFQGVGPLIEKVCDGSGEDPTCVRSSPMTSSMDHLNYYNVHVGCVEPCPLT